MRDWRRFAACKGEPIATFIPSIDIGWAAIRSYDEAKAICATCPVIDECLEWALVHEAHDHSGCWGGTTPRQRRRIRQQRKLAEVAS